MSQNDMEMTITLASADGHTSISRQVPADAPSAALTLLAKCVAALADTRADTGLDQIADLISAESRKARNGEGARRIGGIVEEQGLPY